MFISVQKMSMVTWFSGWSWWSHIAFLSFLSILTRRTLKISQSIKFPIRIQIIEGIELTLGPLGPGSPFSPFAPGSPLGPGNPGGPIGPGGDGGQWSLVAAQYWANVDTLINKYS